MKKGLSFLAAVAICFLCFFSCGEEQKDEEALSLLRSSSEKWKEKDGYSSDFCMNMQAEGLDYTLLFAQGSYTVTSGKDFKRLDSKMSLVSLGSAAEVTSIWEDGVMTSVVAGNEVESEMTEDEVFSSMTYVKPFLPDEKYISSCERLTTGAGSGCRVKLKNAVDILFPLVGNDIFELASIYSPRYDMTKITDAEIIYTIDGEDITGMKITFTLTLYDTPPYVPGGDKPDAEEYSLTVKVSGNMEYR